MPRLLRLVGAGQGTEPPKRRRGFRAPSLSLTDEEARALRASIRNVARTHFGTLRQLAAALGVDRSVLTSKDRPSPALALAVARVAGLSVDVVLGRVGLSVAGGGCPTCGVKTGGAP